MLWFIMCWPLKKVKKPAALAIDDRKEVAIFSLVRGHGQMWDVLVNYSGSARGDLLDNEYDKRLTKHRSGYDGDMKGF